jgi:hypothetical protein
VTNKATGTVREDAIGIVMEFGRPGHKVALRELDRVMTALAKMGADWSELADEDEAFFKSRRFRRRIASILWSDLKSGKVETKFLEMSVMPMELGFRDEQGEGYPRVIEKTCWPARLMHEHRCCRETGNRVFGQNYCLTRGDGNNLVPKRQDLQLKTCALGEWSSDVG